MLSIDFQNLHSLRSIARNEGDDNQELDDDLADLPAPSQPADQPDKQENADAENANVDNDQRAAESNMLAAAGLDSDSDDD